MNQQEIINRLLSIEAGAEVLKKECRKTRKLIEEGVSTSSKPEREVVSQDVIDRVLKNRHRRAFKNKLKIA